MLSGLEGGKQRKTSAKQKRFALRQIFANCHCQLPILASLKIAKSDVALWGILDFKFAPAKNTPSNPAIFSADFGSDMQNKLPGCIFFMSRDVPGL